MSGDASNNGLLEFLKHTWGHTWDYIHAFIAAIIFVVGAIRLLQGNAELVTVILLAFGTSSLWLSSFYIYFKKQAKNGQILDYTEGDKAHIVKWPAYPGWARRFAFAGIIAVPILTIASFSGWKYYQSLPSDKIIILVADFKGPDPQNYRVTETIIEQLREATEEYDDVRVQALDDAITPQQGSEVARARGKEHKASIVLWGWYGKTEERVDVTAHFELLRGLFYLERVAELWKPSIC